ncbi:hypothetical protein NIES37_27430 [Tolypothrix tenuis PCC 7101]|uniref:Uncharacterized protein n=1 Tax=Tolypothrix tenuis PCC 7101 TaxID=231146 RepID=A0A1Z4MZK5_9CYAN|nr:hypothetical protein NIES37_27430 [Tolypothrix tenuis PCC 7101]BAZ77291.1 hypothetical protein NIES50_59200 [Aulosira laxa NIES-50]
MGRGTAPVRYLICRKIADAVPLQRIYLSQTLFESVLVVLINYYFLAVEAWEKSFLKIA